MSDVTEHYQNLLARHYSWMFGGAEVKFEENRRFFREHQIVPKQSGRAVDLGAGPGFQSIPLAEAGFDVTAIDLSAELLAELARHNTEGLGVRIVEDDLRHFPRHVESPVELVVCMGDTLTHLASLDQIEHLFAEIYAHLEPGGRFMATWRDISNPPTGLDRFIPVRSDDSTIFTCFLEDSGSHVAVHDIVHVREESGWTMHKSAYRKLKISSAYGESSLKKAGFTMEFNSTARGFAVLIARK